MTTTWDLIELTTGAAIFDSAGQALSSLAASVQPTNPTMYGTFVAEAAALTEPTTSAADQRVLVALSSSVTGVGDQIRATAATYRAVEELNAGLAREITSSLEPVR